MPATIQIKVPDELANRLSPFEDRLHQILELGLKRFNASDQSVFSGADDVLELLASLPHPQDILSLRPSGNLQARIQFLLEKNRNEGLKPEEEIEWERYQYLEHLVRTAKAKALLKLNQEKS